MDRWNDHRSKDEMRSGKEIDDMQANGRNKVLTAAKSEIGSTDWVCNWTRRGNFTEFEPKCNLFVTEMLSRSGFYVPFPHDAGLLFNIGHGIFNPFKPSKQRPMTCSDWWNEKVPDTIQIFHRNEKMKYFASDFANMKILPGDIITNGEHIGIISVVVTDGNKIIDGKTISASTKDNKIVENKWGFRDEDCANGEMRVFRCLEFGEVKVVGGEIKLNLSPRIDALTLINIAISLIGNCPVTISNHDDEDVHGGRFISYCFDKLVLAAYYHPSKWHGATARVPGDQKRAERGPGEWAIAFTFAERKFFMWGRKTNYDLEKKK